jgi:hypothetical protein
VSSTQRAPGRSGPGQQTEHRTKANDNVVSLKSYRSTRMVKPSGVVRSNAFQLAAA